MIKGGSWGRERKDYRWGMIRHPDSPNGSTLMASSDCYIFLLLNFTDSRIKLNDYKVEVEKTLQCCKNWRYGSVLFALASKGSVKACS